MIYNLFIMKYNLFTKDKYNETIQKKDIQTNKIKNEYRV